VPYRLLFLRNLRYQPLFCRAEGKLANIDFRHDLARGNPMNWVQQIARHCRKLMACAQGTSIVEQLQIWAEELEGEKQQVSHDDIADQGSFVAGATPTVRGTA